MSGHLNHGCTYKWFGPSPFLAGSLALVSPFQNALAQLVADSVGEGVVERPIEDDIREQAGRPLGLGDLSAEEAPLHGLWHRRLPKRGPPRIIVHVLILPPPA